ncbi:MAG: DTW domain-containing protein [Sulfurimonas sp.]|nr:DTW domain-containing protein [Sulfurimonas sp.]
MKTAFGVRKKCYKCYRPQSSCMCKYIRGIETNTKFVVLMHPKEFKKVKNGTGHLTHLSLKNSQLFVGIDFTHHKRVNEIIKEYDSYILYPSKEAINISKESIKSEKKIAIFIIDSTWSCSIKMFRDSKNLKLLKHISFDSTKLSQFKIKEQPKDHCLSTIESTFSVLEILGRWNIESTKKEHLDSFLDPFNKMVKYQQETCKDIAKKSLRYKSNRSSSVKNNSTEPN